MKIKTFLILLAFPLLAHASKCPELYPNSVEIKVPKTIELCNTFYVSRYSPSKKRVELVSEKLTYGTSVGALSRITTFKADPRVGTNGPRPVDYKLSGYDKGHLAASDDAATSIQMAETYLMTNMTPQVPSLNQKAWKYLEDKVRKDFSRSTTDYHILNVPVYVRPYTLVSGIPVPSGYWKVVYSGTSVRYYFGENIINGSVKEYSSIKIDQVISNNSLN